VAVGILLAGSPPERMTRGEVRDRFLRWPFWLPNRCLRDHGAQRKGEPAMGDQVLLLLLGFMLTTVAGGLLGYVFQRRAWSHQFQAQRRSAERDAATSALNELSSLLDKRRYRMLLVYWRLDWEDALELDRSIASYREVLEEWNDGLNRRLALVATHFGSDLKHELDILYEEYREAGGLLEQAIRERRAGSTAADRTALAERLERLNLRNYRFTEAGLAAIVVGRVGNDLPPELRRPTPTPPLSDLGRSVREGG
jgi:hypothetical protein